MPIDPSILRPEPFTPTFRTPGQFEAERAQRDVLRARAGEELAQVQRDQQLRAVLQKHGGNLEAAAGEIAAIDPELGQRVFASVTGRQQQARVAQTAEQAAREKAQADFHGRVSRIFAPDVPEQARATYYSRLQQEAQAKGYSLPESMDEARVLLTPAPKEPEAYTLGPGQARYKGGEVVAQVPAAERVEPREPSPTEASLAVAAAKGDKSAAQALSIIRGQRERQGGGSDNEPVVAIIGPDGKTPVYVPRSQAVGKTPAPSTSARETSEDERKSAGFYSQMQSAIKTMDEVEPKLTENELYQIQSLPQDDLIGRLNRNQLSENAKRYLRAFEQFTEARLRPVSGAAISDSEFARDRRTYSRQYAETPTLAEERKAARLQSLGTLKTRAGRAFSEPEAKDGAPTSGGEWVDAGNGIRIRKKK